MSLAVPWDWNVAVFCRNERWSIVSCIESIADASRDRRTLITLIVNGSSDDSAELALEAAQRRGAPIAVFTIPYGDKANAINRFFHELREPARYYFFIDAYAKIGANSMAVMESLLAERPDAMAATGVASNGRTMLVTEYRAHPDRVEAVCMVSRTRCGRILSIVWWHGTCVCRSDFITANTGPLLDRWRYIISIRCTTSGN